MASAALDLEAENRQLRELLTMYNLGGWTDSERLIKERDAALLKLEASVKALRECEDSRNERSAQFVAACQENLTLQFRLEGESKNVEAALVQIAEQAKQYNELYTERSNLLYRLGSVLALAKMGGAESGESWDNGYDLAIERAQAAARGEPDPYAPVVEKAESIVMTNVTSSCYICDRHGPGFLVCDRDDCPSKEFVVERRSLFAELKEGLEAVRDDERTAAKE